MLRAILIGTLVLTSCGPTQEPCLTGWQKATLDNLVVGQQLFANYGDGELLPMGEVIGTDRRHTFPDGTTSAGVQVQLDDGSRTWRKLQLQPQLGFEWAVECNREETS